MCSDRTNFSDSEYRVKRGEMGSCGCCKTVGCKNRSFPGLLRLDSTGEISSARPGYSYRRPVKKNLTSYQSCSTDDDNLNKNQSVMSSIGAYIGSAAAYIGNFYPQKTLSKELVQNSSCCVPSDCIQGFLLNDPCPSDNTMHSLRPENSLNFRNLHCPLPVSSGTDKAKHWTENILGVLQSSLMNNCTSNKNIMNQHPEVQKYVPPQRRCGGAVTAKYHSTSVDPKLTPYNARLLQKSKQTQSDGQKSFTDTCPHQEPVKSKLCQPQKNLEPPVLRKCEKIIPENSIKQDDLTHSQTSRQIECEQNNNLNDAVSDGHTADVINNNEAETTDWFEYDNRPSESDLIIIPDGKCVPVTHGSSANVSCSQGINSSIQQLRNWYSVENDSEMKDTMEAKSDESSQISETPQSICDNIEIVDNDGEVSKQKVGFPESQGHESHQNSQCPVVADVNEKITPAPVEEKDINTKVLNDGAVKEALFAALYIRNCGKRNRPSAKKRRRHKAQQVSESSDNTDNKKTESKNSLNTSSACQPNSIVAFILGNDSDDDDDSHTVRFHCNFDSDSDWSENDSETDENLSSLDDEELQSSVLGFRCTDSLLFRMSCSVQSSAPVSQEDDTNSIDKINTMWKIQVSVETEVPRRKSKSTKQVRFAESKSLATVHPMVTWCHAYQAARKGPWEQYARDRARFMRRVKEAGDLIQPILHHSHRDRIFNERHAAKS